MCLRFVMKYIRFSFNFLFTCIGLAFMGFGIYHIIKLQNHINGGRINVPGIAVNLQFLYVVPYFLMGLGAVVIFIAFCICYGALEETKWVLVTLISLCLIGIVLTAVVDFLLPNSL